jgi:glyoxylase-like metal-dependent hydrolase (beta-lactamase superfamily II)
MVDCSYGSDSVRELIEAVWAKVLGGRPNTQLIVTHFHPDHAGGSGWIAKRWGLRPRRSHGEWLTANLAVLNRNTDHVQSRAPLSPPRAGGGARPALPRRRGAVQRRA